MKVLYVEDEPFLSKIVKESLESRGFEVELVEDGQLVITALNRFQPDICVLDVMLPHRDGFSLGKEIRLKHPTLPIIFVTAKNQTADVLQGFDSGGNDYLRKPFSVEELIVRMRNLVLLKQGTPAPAPEMIRLGRYEFFPNRQTLSIGQQERTLSYRETQLLEILARQRNIPVPRKEILETVWGNDSIFNSRNLDVYVNHLREYLREDEAVQLLTLKGVGLRLVAP
jgi:DNA-binding response OmpR family regulator